MARAASRNWPSICKANGIKRPLVVTDKGLAAMPMVAEIMADLKKAGLKAGAVLRRAPQPGGGECARRLQGVHATASMTASSRFGGGSGLDVGKLIALMHAQKISIFDLEDIGDWWTRADASVISPIIAVPTTAGTGSEVGRAGVVTHPDHA